MIELKVSPQTSPAKAKTLAEAHNCFPLFWLAIYSPGEIEQACVDDEKIRFACIRSDGLSRLESATPFFVRIFPLSSSLMSFAREFSAMLTSERWKYLHVESDNDGWANLARLHAASQAIENHNTTAHFKLPMRKTTNPFTGEEISIGELNFSSTGEILESLCGYECDWGGGRTWTIYRLPTRRKLAAKRSKRLITFRRSKTPMPFRFAVLHLRFGL